MSAYVGRYHRVRPIGPNGIGAPYVWDRGRAQDAPRMIPAPYDTGERHKGFTRYGEWWRSPEGLWTPAIHGGSGGTYLDGGAEIPRVALVESSETIFGNTLALNNNYVYNTSGNAIASRFILPRADTLSKVYFNIFSFTGTPANVNDLNLELRNSSLTVGPGATLHDSGPGPYDPASTIGWHGTTGWTFALSANTIYWLVVGDADGGGTDFATVFNHLSASTMWAVVARYFSAANAVSTADGWSATRTFTTRAPSVVLLFSSGRTLGNPFIQDSNSVSTTNQRGLRFVAPAGIKLYGMFNSGAINNISGINLWSGANGPGGTAEATGTTPLPINELAAANYGMAFETPPSLVQGTVYRLVFTYSAAFVWPVRHQIGTGADATLRSAMLGGGNWYWAEANGTTDWSNDNISEFPAVDVIVEDFVTAAGAPLALSVSDGLR